MVFATIVSSKYKSVDINAKAFPDDKAKSSSSLISDSSNDDMKELQKKERLALNSWLALIRARSREHLKCWARVEPLGYYFKGLQQPSSTHFGSKD